MSPQIYVRSCIQSSELSINLLKRMLSGEAYSNWILYGMFIYVVRHHAVCEKWTKCIRTNSKIKTKHLNVSSTCCFYEPQIHYDLGFHLLNNFLALHEKQSNIYKYIQISKEKNFKMDCLNSECHTIYASRRFIVELKWALIFFWEKISD